MLLSYEADALLKEIEDIEVRQRAKHESKKQLEESIREYEEKVKLAGENYSVACAAIEILKNVSNNSVQLSYKVMQDNINEALRRIFKDRTRQIELTESMHGNYPQLELKLHVENGVTRSLKYSSGHGIAQVISLLCILSLIVFTGGRRFLILDEVMSGMSKETRELFDSVLWEFSTIGFQYMIVEHDYTPKGAYVIHLESKNELSKITKQYVNTVSESEYENEDDN